MALLRGNSLAISQKMLSVFQASALPHISLRIFISPPSIANIWNSILLAVPKKKTSYTKKRSRLLSGKALKDKTVNRCPICGSFKLAHHLCSHCFRNIRREFNE
ncbi:mitochondrial ribosomal protein subunit L32 [Schizosaccharomyces pombe]|uniref:Large ribosomal subunit protein bL32m n=1 Tax=Schizosaccharomyces pombe (strain 972 / ATCC 24843) TaxID=284812 RepID=RM32_SCHPO|nr:putative mitochondrial ribosomal protein subunit L32 [Schizosaccharomyces pombe]O94379.1 RecName: Full=Large ribosomal subunit protein bL32m; AltName: Full=Probable 54S ribosomal protein L32, mitochondrial; Flags: Precursor [Schizosaccharomyces pombe 972h-]CAA22346.1 mitochondrial ribosomal protein subunit L32 (predicted) [Schizosaccharomyces pombe]|eukprot:NP_596627.1 putative mitochondrial ribosomal protein subunit L32 [Schizosaccharomyces pombe]